MEAKELRIGNWVYDRGGKMLRIDFFEHLQTGFSCKFGMDNPISDEWGPGHPLTEYTDYAKPIPLNPEILEGCGFNHHDRTVSFNDSGYDPKTFYYIDDGRDEFNQIKMLYGFVIGQFKDGHFYYQAGQRRNKGIRVTSLHELQNLYYALTGSDLPVNISQQVK